MLRGKPTEKRSKGKPKLKWKDNIRKDFKEIGMHIKNWNNLAQDRLLESPFEFSSDFWVQ